MTTILCSYADVDKNFIKFTKEKRIKIIFLNPLKSNYCCHFLIIVVKLYKVALFKELESPGLRVAYGHYVLVL